MLNFSGLLIGAEHAPPAQRKAAGVASSGYVVSVFGSGGGRGLDEIDSLVLIEIADRQREKLSRFGIVSFADDRDVGRLGAELAVGQENPADTKTPVQRPRPGKR